MTPNQAGEILCSVCNASNDSSWAFCQQCGSPLQSQPQVTPPAVRPTPQSVPYTPPPMPPTVIAQPVMPPTVVAQPVAPPTVIAQPVAPPPMPPAPPTVVAQPIAPPTVIAQPVVAPPTVIAQPVVPPPAPPTVVAQPIAPPTVVAQPVAAPPTVIAQPAVPAAPPTVIARPVSGGTADIGNGIACGNCGKINQLGSSFCAGCGSPLPAEKTLFMSAQKAAPVARLRLIQEGGGEGEAYKLETDDTVIGRNKGSITFPHDGYMSGVHARIVRKGEEFVLVDENSRNGTFKKIDGPVTLKPGDVILIGKQLFRFEM